MSKHYTLMAALGCSMMLPLALNASEAGSSKSFNYVTTSPIDGKAIASYIMDANNGANYFYLKNEKMHVNFSTVSSGNNGYGSMRPGTPMDVMPSADNAYVDCLDWCEMILIPSSDLEDTVEASNLKKWDWNSKQRHLSLPSMSAIDKRYVIASGAWESSDSIRATAVYTLLDNEPIMRIELTLKNLGRTPFVGAMGYLIDHDLGDQFCYLPGKGWGKTNSLAAIKSGWTSNYVYEGTDVIRNKSVPAHGLAWDSSKVSPYAILYPGYIMGSWFSVEIPASGTQTITYYHMVSEPSRTAGVTTYAPIADLAQKVIGDSYSTPYIPVISGRVTDKDGINPIVGAQLVCRDIEANSVATAVTNADGYYEMRVPIGTYTTTVNRIAYLKESRSIEVNEAIDYTLDFVMDNITGTYASYGERMQGKWVEATDGDLTLQNSKIALTLADEFVDTQMKSSKGKPIDFGFTNQTDAFDWINIPIVTYDKVLSENAWNHHAVKFDSLYVDETSDLLTRVIAEGTCDTIPLNVKTVYELRPEESWVSIVSTFTNTSDKSIVVWISDAMDLDETGEKAFYPSENGLVTITDNKVTVEYTPVQPWMGQYGTLSNQSFGLVYSGDFAVDMTLYGCLRWMVARKQVSIAPGASYEMSRKLVAVETVADEDRADAFLNFYNQYLGSNLEFDVNFDIETRRPLPGEQFKIAYTITNTSENVTYQNIVAQLTLPANLTVDSDQLTLASIAPGERKELSWTVNTIEGGGNRVVRATLFADDELVNNSRAQLFIAGRGWYAGDNHTHSKHSDGSGTIAENLTAARNKGLSFVSGTDHNKVSQAADLIAFNQQNDDIIGVLGNEVSISGVGHVVALFTNEVIPYSNINTAEKAQGVINNIQRSNDNKGLAFIAHPYYPGLEWKYPTVRGMRGYEVWNGFYKPKHSVNSRAFKLWDTRIMQDGEAYLGIANSDGHNSGKISDPHIRVLCDEFNEIAYHHSINIGHFYGTDGPDIRFNIGNHMMGDTLLVPAEGTTINLDIRAMNAKGVDSLRVIKNGEVIVAEKITAATDLNRRYSQQARPGDYFRVEVDGSDATFAFSNPIFVREDTLSTGVDRTPVTACYVRYLAASNMLEVTTPSNETLLMSLLSTAGQLIDRKTLSGSNSYTFTLPTLQSGVYLVVINGSCYKFVVR